MSTWKLNPDTGQVSGSHSDMPLVVIPSEIETGAITLAEAQSSRIYTDAGLVTEVAREVVSANELHFKSPSVDGTDEYWWDFDGVRSDYAVGATYGRNNVWSDYGAVWHMNQDPGGTPPQIVDSTGNGNSGTSIGGMNSSDLVTGQIGDGIDFDGSNDQIGGADSPSLSPTSELTIQTWVNWDAFSGANVDRIYHKNQSGNNSDNQWLGAVSGKAIIRFQDSGGTLRSVTGSTSLSTNTWYNLHGTYDGTELNIYVDASADATPLSITSGITDSSGIWRMSGDPVPRNWVNGVLDEIRVKGTALSANWITTEYNNQNDNAAYWVATDVSGGGSSIKSINGVAKADIKSFNGVTDANIKSVNGISNV